jgi:hypothetical protein
MPVAPAFERLRQVHHLITGAQSSRPACFVLFFEKKKKKERKKGRSKVPYLISSTLIKFF